MAGELLSQLSEILASTARVKTKPIQKPMTLNEQIPGWEENSFFSDVNAHTPHIAPESEEQRSASLSRVGRVGAKEQKILYENSGIVYN